ncbi:TonB-dependent receptor plug domain-containing protein [Bowmanella denitrificans]|uniref:TonB-dependent receptor plug domain-containing protein n=1 Tax=Bowmanella denitrificans TaxID=366582 RepID=UPI000C9C5372|nr:Plug domain-containing protein [Bowmanella denitrificans]
MNCSQPSIRPLALLVSMSLPHVAYAQSPQTTEHRIEEIVVTVQQQNQVITEVPVALSAFSNKELEKMNLTDFERIAALTPGFISQQQTDSSASFVIRGVEAAGTGAAAEPTISIFYNGVDSSRSRGAVKELYDIERVEVVKGP